MYKLHNNPDTNQLENIIRVSDKSYIPLDENNRDYQTYLKWVAEGNTPQPADE
jgi:hypothetical protein